MIKKKDTLVTLGVITYLVMLIILYGCTENTFTGPYWGDPSNLRIGYMTELYTTEIGSSYKACMMATEEINAAGGVEGKQIELVVRDAYPNGGDQAIVSANEYHDAGMDFIIGPGWSSRTLKAATVTVANGQLMMPYSATSPAITDLDDSGLIWRSCVSDAFQGVVAADYIYSDLGIDTAATIYRDDGWGAGMAAAFQESFEALGGTVIAAVDYPAETEDFALYDFSTHANEAVQGHPQLIFYITYDDDASKMMNDLYLNSTYQADKPILFGVEGIYINRLAVSIPAAMLEGQLAISAVTDQRAASNFMTFRENYMARFPSLDEPDYYTATAYDNLYLMAYAMVKAGTSTNAAAVAAELKDVSGGVAGATVININEFANGNTIATAGGDIDYNGASGAILFDDNGDPQSAIFEIQRAAGGVVVVDSTIYFGFE